MKKDTFKFNNETLTLPKSIKQDINVVTHKLQDGVVAFLSDIHSVFYERDAFYAAMEFITSLRPSFIILGGDIVDFYSISRFDKDPTRLRTDTEIIAVRTLLKYIRYKNPVAKIIYLEGNHEQRFSKFISSTSKNAEELLAILSLANVNIQTLLQLKELNIEYFETKKWLKINDTLYIHGHQLMTMAEFVAKQYALAFKCNVVFGHHHRSDRSRQYNKLGGSIEAIAVPCLSERSPEYKLVAKTPYENGFFVNTIQNNKENKKLVLIEEGQYYFR